MTTDTMPLIPEIASLSDRAKDTLVTRLLKSVDEPSSEEIDTLWLAEAESRIEACEKGLMKTVPLSEIKRKFEQRARK